MCVYTSYSLSEGHSVKVLVVLGRGDNLVKDGPVMGGRNTVERGHLHQKSMAAVLETK